MENLLNNKVIKWIIIIVIVVAAIWLGSIVINALGGHAGANLGTSTSNVGFQVGGAKTN